MVIGGGANVLTTPLKYALELYCATRIDSSKNLRFLIKYEYMSKYSLKFLSWSSTASFGEERVRGMHLPTLSF